MKIGVLHRYPPDQVVGTNASFIEFLSELDKNDFEIYYVSYGPIKERPPIDHLYYATLPFNFDRGNYFDKVLKTYMWMFLAPLCVLYLQVKHNLEFVYCDDSVPYYSFLSKLFSPKSKVIIRLGDLQSAYELYDNHKYLYKIAHSIEVFMWKRFDGIVAISEEFKRYICSEGIDESKVKVVEESISLKDNKLVPIYNKTILFHGSIVKCKGLTTLLDAFSEIYKKDSEFKLIIAGGGGEETFLKSYVATNNIKNVEFTGWYNPEDLERIMSKVGVSIVMRSPNFANNFIVTTCLLENWKYGKPSLAPNLKSFASIIENGKNGILFEAGNPIDLAKKLLSLYKNKDNWQSLVNNGYLTAEKTFNHKLIAKKMVNTLKSYI